jgi:hypothetical protein
MFSLKRSFVTPSGVEPSHNARPWGVGALAILTDHEQRKTKILYDYEHVDPAGGIEPP